MGIRLWGKCALAGVLGKSKSSWVVLSETHERETTTDVTLSPEGLHGHEGLVGAGAAVPHAHGLVVAAAHQGLVRGPVADLREPHVHVTDETSF